MKTSCENRQDSNNDGLRETHESLVLVVRYGQEQADQGYLHDVDTCKELVDGLWEQETSCVEAELVYVQRVVPICDPKEAESDDVEDHDERRNDREYEAYSRLI